MKRLFKPTKRARRQVRHRRIRAHLQGTAALPRLSVFRGRRAIEAQLIDDVNGKTLCAVNSRSAVVVPVNGKSGKVAIGYLVGKVLAEKAKAKGIARVVFDRGGYKFHGRVAALAEGVRDGGLTF